jgi:hypothetical protein
MSKGKWGEKGNCLLCNNRRYVQDHSYPNGFMGIYFSKVCPRCKGNVVTRKSNKNENNKKLALQTYSNCNCCSNDTISICCSF